MNTSHIDYVKDTFPEYLGKKDHISSSDIKNFLKSPKIYFDSKYNKKPSKAMGDRHYAVGSAIHEIILEPHQFLNNYIISPVFNRRTKAGKQEYLDFLKVADGRTIVTNVEMEAIERMASETLRNKTLVSLVANSHRELSCYTTDEKTGLKIKVRPDVLCIGKSTILDLKSCLDSSYKKFRTSVFKFGYYISAPFYMDFLNRENYIFGAIEKNAPYQNTLYSLDDEIIEKGRKDIRLALDLLKWSYQNNYWCDYIEFEMLKECYELGEEAMNKFFETKNKSEKIMIVRA